jgi:hypothetical protein
MTLAAIEYTDAEQMRADYAARRRRFFHTPNIVSLEAVRRDVPTPVQELAPEASNDPVVEIPNFLSLRDRARDWVDLTSKGALKPADSTIVLRIVVEQLGISKRDIISERRTAEVMRPRMIACWLMRKATTMSLPMIGRKIGRRDHTTVLNACRKIDRLREREEGLRALTDQLLTMVEEEIASCED